MIKLKIEMDAVKIHNESELSLEETYSKINEVIDSIPNTYRKGNFVYTHKTSDGLDDVGTLLIVIDSLATKDWFTPYAKELTLIDRDGEDNFMEVMTKERIELYRLAGY